MCAVVYRKGQNSLDDSHFLSMCRDMSKFAGLWFKCCGPVMTPSTAQQGSLNDRLDYFSGDLNSKAYAPLVFND